MSFNEKIEAHVQHILRVGEHCTTEETTKQALILPMLGILGFEPYDPTKVKAEYAADFAGAKNNERVDYALFCQGLPVMLIEAKAYNENLTNHAPQLARYFNATPEVEFAIITNGKEWRFFTDLKNKNVMDDKPFLRINFTENYQSKIDSLAKFCYDSFQTDALKTLAEESSYLNAFAKTITTSLQDIPAEFVRYVASNSDINRQLNQRFIENITPIVKQAVEKSISAMLVSGLSQTPIAPPQEIPTEEEIENADIVDPNNSKIVTTQTEQALFNFTYEMLDEADIQWKDTESYFCVLYQGKTNRWLFRYFDNKQRPYIVMPFELSDLHQQELKRARLEFTDNNHIFIEKPENILRISGIIQDALEYCQNDENFRKK